MSMNEEQWEHIRAILITLGTTLTGVIAGVVSSAVTAGIEDPGVAASDPTGLLALPAAIAIQIPVYQQAFDDWGGGRDLLFVVFMTFCLWFITWGMLLTTGAQIV